MRQIVVTGGGTGIGKAIAAAFLQAGNGVVITGRRPETLAAAVADLGGPVRAVSFDATDPDQVERALAELPRPSTSWSTTQAATPTSALRTRRVLPR